MVKISKNGSVNIPKVIREKLSISAGGEVSFVQTPQGLLLQISQPTHAVQSDIHVEHKMVESEVAQIKPIVNEVVCESVLAKPMVVMVQNQSECAVEISKISETVVCENRAEVSNHLQDKSLNNF